jgi:hypothetical protein
MVAAAIEAKGKRYKQNESDALKKDTTRMLNEIGQAGSELTDEKIVEYKNKLTNHIKAVDERINAEGA